MFLDVDGTLIPFGASQSAPSTPGWDDVREGVNPLLSRLAPQHGSRLSALPCDLVWATTWMDDANDEIAPLLGLPALPVVGWPDSDEDGPLHWKTRALVAWADGGRSSGSTTRSATLTVLGYPPITRGPPFCTVSTRAGA